MKLYREAKRRDIDNLAMQLKKANGRIKNHFPHGFESILNFGFGDVFISDKLFALLNSDICQEIDFCLVRMWKEDYGIVNDETKEINGEKRYFGSGKGIVGRYEIGIGKIEISILDTYTYINLVV